LANGIDRLSRLVSDLLDSARLEHGLFALDRRETELVRLAGEVAATAVTSADRVRVITCIPELYVNVDAERLRQALENLLANAVKYSPESAPITVQVNTEQRANGAWCLVSVSD